MEAWKYEILKMLRMLISEGQLDEAKKAVDGMHAADLAKIMEHLREDEKNQLFGELDTKTASEVVVELSEASLEQILEGAGTERLADILDDMPSDEATDIISELPPDQAREVMQRIDLEDTHEIKILSKYPEDTAGGIMQLEMVSARPEQTVSQVIAAIRLKVDEVGELYNVFVVDKDNHVLGILPLTRLVLAKAGTPISELYEPCPLVVKATEDQETVAHKFRRYDVASAPVVDENDRLVGRIMIDDIMEVYEEEIREDLLRMAGSSSEEEMFYSNRIFRISRARLPWLLTNLFGGLITGWLLWKFRITLADAIFLVTFVPVITAMGGNVGIQSSTVMVRGFAVGAITYRDLGKVLFKEFRVALVMGVTCGTAVGLVAELWHGKPLLGVVVGLAMLGAITMASLVGTLAPALFKRLGVDPAISSGPFVTTANDITGILIYFSIATVFYKQLVG